MPDLPSPEELELAIKSGLLTEDDQAFLVQYERDIQENRIDYYKPYPKQVQFHQSPAPYRLLSGANRCGKTVSGATEAIWYALGKHPYKKIQTPNEGWIVSSDYNVQKEASQRIITDYLPKNAIKKISHVKSEVIDTIFLKNGSKITFKSTDSGVDRFAGAAKRWIWFDEEPPRNVWRECIARIGAGQPLDVWLTMTPIFEQKGKKVGMTWTHRELYKKRDNTRIFCIVVGIEDNIFLTKEQVSEQKKKYEGLPEYDIRIKGEFKLLAGNNVFSPERIEHHRPP